MPIVSFMPYYPDDRINKTIGKFHVWNWFNWREKIVQDTKVKTYLEKYFQRYVGSDGKQERRIAIVSKVGRSPFPEKDEFSVREMGRFLAGFMACHLFYLSTPPTDSGWMACSSDNFTAMFQPFDPAQDTGIFAFTHGSYVKTKVFGSWDELRFTTPQFMPDPFSA